MKITSEGHLIFENAAGRTIVVSHDAHTTRLSSYCLLKTKMTLPIYSKDNVSFKRLFLFTIILNVAHIVSLIADAFQAFVTQLHISAQNTSLIYCDRRLR